MSARVTFAVAVRVMLQLRRDPRTLALMVVVPCLLLALVKGAFDGQPGTFDRVGGPLVGIFPLILMFLITSITMLRERTTGTLERLMTMRSRSSTCWPGTGSRSRSSPRFRGRSSGRSRSSSSTSTPPARRCS